MKPTQCPACQGNQLVVLAIRGEFWIAPFRLAKAHHSACLDCGVVTAYLDDATVARLRTRRHVPVKTKALTDEL